MSDYTVRPAEPRDHDAVGALTVRAYVDDGHIPADADYTVRLADAGGRAADALLLVAVDEDDEPVGTVTFAVAGSPMAELSREGEAEFRMLAVSPRARGRGVGEALVRACLDEARRAGARTVVLSTQPRMTAAHRIYERLGFTRTPERDWSPVPGVDLLAYRLDL
ncbi:GNAT family N-acetyltransferase [Oryzihumus leptocrescens]|uniref:Putative N-acetyltransferase YhbS n=1 Tax=Oryzihumus leptocrescens TaxID=297536 RepID=A0A542ZLV4_9MICO|nr:GNAT family N-acetyltransferase [Oryzihumus leptocrescens]TQL61249.1 putative N-acetyltransferase YhbS [Oryzihumus leptocrescens]